MSDFDDYTSSGDVYYDDDTDSGSSESNETSQRFQYVYAGTNTLLSSPANRVNFNEGVTQSLACPQSYLDESKNPETGDIGMTNTQISDEEKFEKEVARVRGEKQGREEERQRAEDELYSAYVKTPTMDKVVPLASLKPVERKIVEMGELTISSSMPVAAATKSVNTPLSITKPSKLTSQLTPLTAYSEKEIDGFVLEQNARQLNLMKQAISLSTSPSKVAKTMKARKASLNAAAAKDELTPLSQYSEQQLEALALRQANRYTNFACRATTTATASSSKGVATMTPSMNSKKEEEEDELTPLSQFTQVELKMMSMKQASRNLLTPLSSFSDEKIQALKAKQDETRTLYSLKKLSTLPTHKFNALCSQQQKSITPSDRVRTLTKNATPFSHPHFNDPLSASDIDSLSLEELRAIVRECRMHHRNMPGKLIDDSTMSRVIRQRDISGQSTSLTTPVGKSQSFAAHVTKHSRPEIRLQQVNTSVASRSPSPSIQTSATAPTKAPLLCNFNNLPGSQQQALLASLQLGEAFQNKSLLSAKKEYELNLSSTLLSSPIVLGLYHGLSAKKGGIASSSLSCPHNEDINGDGHVSVLEHLVANHPLYTHLMKKHLGRRMVKGLVKNSERNVLFIVPGRALLALYQQQGELVNMTKLALAYLTVLMRRGEKIPANNVHYEATNLLEDRPVTIRRIDDETLEIDGSRIAKLDPGSGGRVYTVVEPSIEDLDQETVANIVATEKATEEEKAEADLNAEELADAEAEAEIRAEEEREARLAEGGEEEEEEEAMAEAEKRVSPLDRESVIPSEPQVIRTLPATDDEALALIEREEEAPTSMPVITAPTPSTSTTSTTSTTRRTTTIPPITTAPVAAAKCVVLSGVFKNSHFKNRKFEALASKMFNTNYNGAKDMANYVDHSASMQGYANQLFLKTFTYDSLFDKYRHNATALEGAERLTPDASFRLEHRETLTYDLDTALQMREFMLDTTKMKINKRQLMNHFNVLCFKTKKENQYATVSFTLPDETMSLTDTYTSSDENLLLKFKDNLLQSVTINTNGTNFLFASLPEQSLGFVGLGSDITQHITTKVTISPSLYDKELNYSQFMSAVLPLSQSSVFLKRLRAIRQELMGKAPIPLSKLGDARSKRLMSEIDNTYSKHITETTEDVRISIGRGALAVSRLRAFPMNRDVHRKPNTDNYVAKYEYENAGLQNEPQISFKDLLPVTGRASDRPTLTIELLNPFKDKKELFRFNLASLKSPTATTGIGGQIVYAGETVDGGHLLFDFILNKEANLQEIFVRYTKRGRRSGLSAYESELTKFLASEAYAYQKHGLDLASHYMGTRLNKYLLNSGLNSTKIDGPRYREFFTSLNKEIKRYMESEKLSTLLTNLPATNVTVEKSRLLFASGYENLRVDETDSYRALLSTGFAPLNGKADSSTNIKATSVPNVVKLAIREYSALSAAASNAPLVKDQSFALYMDRLLYVTAIMSDAFKSV